MGKRLKKKRHREKSTETRGGSNKAMRREVKSLNNHQAKRLHRQS